MVSFIQAFSVVTNKKDSDTIYSVCLKSDYQYIIPELLNPRTTQKLLFKKA